MERKLFQNYWGEEVVIFSEKAIFSANVIEKLTLAKAQNSEISSAHNSNVGHFGLYSTLKSLKAIGQVWEFQRQHVRYFIGHCQKMSLLKIHIRAQGFTTSTNMPIAWQTQTFFGRFQTTDTSFLIVDTLNRLVEL
jgi:hypothetical protein